MLADHARRVRSDYNRLNRQAGGEMADGDGDGDDMGNITITGDINVADARQANRILDKLGNQNGQQPPTPPQPQPPTTSMLQKLAPWILAAGAGLGGAGAGAWLMDKQTEPPAVVPSDPEMPKYDVEKWVPKRPTIKNACATA